MRAGRLPVAVLLAAFALLSLPPAARAADELGQMERAFQEAIDTTLPATVVCLAADGRGQVLECTGVIATRKGLVLTDSTAGVYLMRSGRNFTQELSDDIEVRVPDLRRGGFTPYRARVIRRDKDVDTSLLEITNPPQGGFPRFLAPAASGHLRVGDYTFVAGNAFGLSNEAPPSLTAGVVAALTEFAEGDPLAGKQGRYQHIYTGAAVNRGVNGGPLVDAAGRLVGTISNWVQPEPGAPYQFLGKVIPMDRIRAVYADLPESRELFPNYMKGTPQGLDVVRKLETVFRETARHGASVLAGISVERQKPLEWLPARQGAPSLARYQGPYSGVVVSRDGLIVTGLYSLTSVAELCFPGLDRALPPEMRLRGVLGQITSITAHYAGGRSAKVTVLGYHEGLGVAVLGPAEEDRAKLDLPFAGARGAVLPAPDSAFTAGRFVISISRPYGDSGPPDPLLAVGVLSKHHGPGGTDPWRGHWQTDAASTDATVGGAALDIEGRLLGMASIWNPTRHGRNSGVGFVVPWADVAAVMGELANGRTFARPFLGVMWDIPEKDPPKDPAPLIKEVIADSAAAKAGVEVGDLILSVDGQGIATISDLQKALSGRWSGDEITIGVERAGARKDLKVVLGSRP